LYSVFKLTKKYLNYWLTASNGKGHGIHSPFVFDFIKNVLNAETNKEICRKIETCRKELLHNNSMIVVDDFGAGSSVIKSNTRCVKKIAASSLKPKKFSQLIHRIVKYYKPENIIELGTSFGITTAYLATGNETAEVHTFEGAKNIANIAQKNFSSLGLPNIKIHHGDFNETLPTFLQYTEKKIDLAFIDGNHRKIPTIQYFNLLKKHANENTILIFDDIHWSEEMEAAWIDIKNSPEVTLTIDLFFIGLVFFKKDFKARQHFTIQF
jgi:predicted O-methyltransferase YrrM